MHSANSSADALSLRSIPFRPSSTISQTPPTSVAIIGIPKEAIGKIWERFYKTDLSRGKDKKGTGIGLAIVKEIIQAHGENINVISTEGVGTEFIFTLPFVDDSE